MGRWRWWLVLAAGCSATPSADGPVATVEVEPSGAEARAADDDEPPAPVAAPKCDRVTAQMHFDMGKELLAQGRAAEACEKLEASLQCEAALGALMNLSFCYEQLGDKLRACEKLQAALAMGATDARLQFMQERASRLGC